MIRASLAIALIALSLSFVPVAGHAGNQACTVPGDEPTVQDAIDNNTCALIRLGTGTFTETVTADRSFELVGKGRTNTFLSGGDAGRVLDIGANADEVVIRNLTLADGLTQSGGAGLQSLAQKLTLNGVGVVNNEINNSGPPATTAGAGIFAGYEVRIHNSLIRGNEFQGNEIGLGGGIFVSSFNSEFTITKTKIVKNVADTGGGLYAENGTTVIRNSTIRGNAAISAEPGADGGGGIAVAGGKVSIFDSTIQGNQAIDPSPHGGGISVTEFGELNLVRSTVAKNDAGIDGGGIHVGDAGAKATIKNSKIIGNETAIGFGGGINNQGRTIVRNSTIASNTSGEGGAGIENFGSNAFLTLVNSTISGNEADDYGGGIDSYNGSKARITNVTFTKNKAGAPGGGFHSDGSDFTVKNVVTAFNTASFGHDCDGDFVSLGGNVARNDDNCDNLNKPTDTFKNPRLGPLAFNGGPTRTHMLKPGSPAIGRGRPGCPGSDQRGAPREDCDSGAYERVKCRGSLVSIVGTGVKDKLRGTGNGDGILGLGGKDRLIGRGGKDGLCGGRGNDRLAGGTGNDRLDGEDGTDICIGGPGSDSARACETERSI